MTDKPASPEPKPDLPPLPQVHPKPDVPKRVIDPNKPVVPKGGGCP